MKKKTAVPRYAEQYRVTLETQEEARARLGQNPAVREYLKQFYDNGDSFFGYYLNWRTEMLQKGAKALAAEHKAARKLVRTATQRLWQIQQRKLFVLQCQWRADEVDLRAHGIETSADFGTWGQRIHQCDWLPPIAPDEVEEYLAYLETDDCQDLNPHIKYKVRHWQLRDAFWHDVRGVLDEGDLLAVQAAAELATWGKQHDMQSLAGDLNLLYPMWYYWCDEHHHPRTPLLSLPNHRGHREGRYLSAALRQQAPDPTPLPAPAPVFAPPAPTSAPAPAAPAPHYLHSLQPGNAYLTHLLLQAFEPARTQQHYEACFGGKARVAAFGWDLDTFLFTHGETIEDDLLREGHILPMRAHSDYRQGLYHTWLSYYRQRLQAAIRREYAAYQQRQATGQRHPDPYADPKARAEQKSLRKEYRHLILTGRALLGEPQNFDF